MDRDGAAPTFFARPAWAIAIQRAYAHLVPWPLSCQLDDGSDAVIPLMRVYGGRLPWKIYHGMPFDGYTAVLTKDNELVEASTAAQVVRALLFQGDQVLLNLWPFEALRVVGPDVRIAAETSALDISGGVERALSKIGSKSRRMAGQARRKGATCAIEPGESSIALYFDLLQETAKHRWHRARPPLRKELLQEVCLQAKDAAEIWIVRYEGAPVAGGIALYGSQEVLLWTTATRPSMEILRPHNLLHATIIEHAAERGIRWYNLSSSSNLEGVLRFKRALGANLLKYEILGHESLPFRIVKALKHIRRLRHSPGVSS